MREALELEQQLAEQKVTTREKLKHMESLPAADVDTIALAALIATAEASGVEPGEVNKARILLARAKAAQEVKRQREEVAALEALRLATAPEVGSISRAQLEAALAACRACSAPAHEVEAGQARLVQVIKWQALSAASTPNAEGECDLAALREAIDAASAVGLPPSAEAQAALLRAEEAAKERVVRQKMRREAEKNLNAAMPSLFGMNKTDATKLGKAVDIAKANGVDAKLIAAAEAKLLHMRAEAEAKAKVEAETLAHPTLTLPLTLTLTRTLTLTLNPNPNPDQVFMEAFLDRRDTERDAERRSEGEGISAAWAPAADAQQAAQLELSRRLSSASAPCPM